MGSKPQPEKPSSNILRGQTARGIDFESNQELLERATRIVPCGKCVACCQGDAIILHPEDGDDVSLYKTEVHDGRLMLAHKYNKDCYYLDRKKGCTIHNYRPLVCREFDCAVIMLEDPRIYTRMASPAVIRAGKKRIKKLRVKIKRRNNLKKLGIKK